MGDAADVSRSFAPGEVIAARTTDRHARLVFSALPQIVVRDDAELVVTYMPAGATGWRRAGERAGPRGRQLVRWDGGYEPRIWSRTNVLMLYRPGDEHSVWVAWDAATWKHVWWYVNLEEAWRRTAIGFDTRDEELDLWAGPDLHEVHLKDEDELDFATRQGRFTPARADAIRARARHLAGAIERHERPFSDPWPEWRPDPGWAPPLLHPHWRRYEP